VSPYRTDAGDARLDALRQPLADDIVHDGGALLVVASNYHAACSRCALERCHPFRDAALIRPCRADVRCQAGGVHHWECPQGWDLSLERRLKRQADNDSLVVLVSFCCGSACLYLTNGAGLAEPLAKTKPTQLPCLLSSPSSEARTAEASVMVCKILISNNI
jgi:hypothetical protein